VIDGDTNFSATALLEGWPGDGSPGNPYIIDGLDIDLDGNDGACISIGNTRVNFIICNCSLAGASSAEGGFGRGCGIYLENVTHGELVKNILDGNRFGIWVDRSNYSTVSDNTFTNNVFDGIDLASSTHNIVVNNTFFNNICGIHLRFSSTSNTLVNNTCYNNTIGIYLNNSQSNTVANNTCNNNSLVGIHLFYFADYNTVSNNTCSGNGESGISLGISDSNMIVNNTCNYNGIGIHLENSYSKTVANNTCLVNNEHGILEEYEYEAVQPAGVILLLMITGIVLLFGYWLCDKAAEE